MAPEEDRILLFRTEPAYWINNTYGNSQCKPKGRRHYDVQNISKAHEICKWKR